MSIGPRLDLRQSQSLVMTPQLQQAIRLLALSNLEVEGFIAEELEKNPLLESGAGGEAEEAPEAEASAPPELPASAEVLAIRGDGTAEAPLDMEHGDENLHQDSESDRSMASPPGGDGAPGDGPDFERVAAHGVSLHEHLLAQAGELLSGPDLIIAARIVEQIEETGYFQGSTLEIARRLGAAPAEAERILAVVQTFDPSGVGARSLAECLIIQAKEADRYDPAMARLIDNLDHLARGNLPALKRICAVDDEDLADMIRELRAYDPKPGCRFDAHDRIDSVVPDLFVARRAQGWSIELNEATLPRLLVNRTYHAELAGGAKDRVSKAWLSECLTSANWLIKALDQRARTIVKVATEIVKQQEGFFRSGVSELRPLTLRQVAEAIGMHESTVSRVTSNKYLSCDRGLYELKYFFTSGIRAMDAADGGESVSAEAVKSHLRALIAAEDGHAILSDDQIVDLLRARGFDIARRTVAKYREAIGIGSSVQRRRQKAIGARAA
jgi:RNA polymerase sigma-54 factor